MQSKDSQFVGAAGTYYVMAKLASMRIHASVTFGNAPYVDILACSPTGEKQIAIQVKTAEFARRTRGRGSDKKWAKLDWALSYKAVKTPKSNLFFAFVDLGGAWDFHQSSNIWQPTVYIIPSVRLTNEICKDWQEGWWRLQVDNNVIDSFKEDWKSIEEALTEQLINEPVATMKEELNSL
ncbi:hypothetical protein [Spirosoma montaniterrae]|nr:hypothetical protein [Spirosoma montaniterrae]